MTNRYKSADMWEGGGVKIAKKVMTYFMDGPYVYFVAPDCRQHHTKVY